MDITKKAKEVSEKGGPYSTNKQNYEFMFLEGYNAACEWFPMETCPKDGNKVLIADDGGAHGIHVFCASWDQSNFSTKKMDWCIDEAYYDEGNITIYNPVAWMPLPKYTHKP